MPTKAATPNPNNIGVRKCIQCGVTKPMGKFISYRNYVKSRRCRECYNANARGKYNQKAKANYVIKQTPVDDTLYELAMKALNRCIGVKK